MIICLVTIDQLVKLNVIKNIYNTSTTVIDEVLNLTYIENTGGAFGIANNNTIMFVIINIIVITIISKIIILKRNEISTKILIGLGLILAGGIGNLIDRIFRGFVVDYIDFNPIIKYPVFNIADIYVVLGCMIIVINIIIGMIKKENDYS